MREACKDTGPKKRPRHHSYDERVDEPAKLLDPASHINGNIYEPAVLT